jgi:hypothetical protein
MTSQLKVDRISPATGSEIIIDGDEKYFHVYKKSEQIVENNVSTKVVLDTVHSDPYGAWSSSNNEYTIPSDGLYMVHSNLSAHDKGVSQGLVNVIVDIYLNGSLQTQGRNSNNFDNSTTAVTAPVNSLFTNILTRVLPLSAGDKISWYARFSCKYPETPSVLFVGGNETYHNSFAWIYKVASS